MVSDKRKVAKSQLRLDWQAAHGGDLYDSALSATLTPSEIRQALLRALHLLGLRNDRQVLAMSNDAQN